jgi:hypothetical protein
MARWLVLGGAVALASCAKSGGEPTFLQEQDVQSSPGFDKNEIVDTAAFIDAIALDAAAIQNFFAHTPYNRPSFLASYQSNGVRASEAIARSATGQRINPIVFIVRAEMEQGLVGEQFYPSQASRVEYAFGCGCDGKGNCDPLLAGFDAQVDCLARALRKSLDAIAANGATEGGWAPGVQKATVDGQRVTPRDEATAALYQYTPKVGQGTGGNWLFWNVWQLYTNALAYYGPVGAPMNGGLVGDACTSNATCNFADAICATNYPGGLCTAPCTTTCPASEGMGGSFCASFQQAGYCLAVCDPMVPTSCRAGYGCKQAQQFGSRTASAYVCVAN